MKVLMIFPFPVEFNASRELLSPRDTKPVSGCRSARGVVGNTDVFAIESSPAKAGAAVATGAVTDPRELLQ